MTAYSSFVYPILSQIDAERSHRLTLKLLQKAQQTTLGRKFLKTIAGNISSQPIKVAGLTFPNVLGVAAGFDKDIEVAPGLAALGFGHIETGTLTPRPQVGNPTPRIFRLPADGALINRMGFPNCGVLAALPRLRAISQSPRRYILGVSLGKQKETLLEDAAADYIYVMKAVYPFADYLAVNVSSPNTPGLRQLQSSGYLGRLLGNLSVENNRLARQTGRSPLPLFLKIAPDVTSEDLDDILFAALANQVAGIIAANTTISRDGLHSPRQEEVGGLSGRPLKFRARFLVKEICQRTQGKLAVVGVGGVETFEDVQAMLNAGASLVQMYTGLVYHGPGVVGRLLRAQTQAYNWQERI